MKPRTSINVGTSWGSRGDIQERKTQVTQVTQELVRKASYVESSVGSHHRFQDEVRVPPAPGDCSKLANTKAGSWIFIPIMLIYR